MDAHEQTVIDGTQPHVTKGEWLNIKFQLGPIKEVGVNGVQIEDVLNVVIARLDGFQRGPFACAENEGALSHLNAAKACLVGRARKRQVQGIEGLNKAHVH